ncbi:MAG: hypothetical protein M5U01_08600 [Ardenticatenaceae bacterium]|nr:hypothetical protein [Ardenticatenaceae bacterium]
MFGWKTFLPGLVLVLALGVYAPAGTETALAARAPLGSPRPSYYILPGEAVFPEGIAAQQSAGVFYVSSTTDGTIFRGYFKDQVTSVFLPGGEDGRTTATGLAVDEKNDRLFIAGGASGKLFVYDIASKTLLAAFDNGATTTFVNDVTVTRDGDAFATDSFRPVIYRVFVGVNGQFQFEEWLDLTGTPIEYQPGFNLNGIVASNDGKYLVVVQSNTGELFRITIATGEITKIDLGGETVTAGDGLLLKGRTLYVVRNQFEEIVEVRLTGDLSSGTIVSRTSDPSFAFPTTIAQLSGRLLVVNSQLNKQGQTPDLPFTVSSIKYP